jgi:hypothetical protein
MLGYLIPHRAKNVTDCFQSPENQLMGWPKGRPRKRHLIPRVPPEPKREKAIPQSRHQFADVDIPESWQRGALLNVRNMGEEYIVSLYPDEYDYRKPENGIRFPSAWECQNFVSNWYARPEVDPRAF